MTASPHDHVFGQDQVRPGERKTLWVIGITAAMMVVEIAAGVLFGSMALLADGLHMGSHAVALSVAAAAYIYARRHARDQRFSFGTGKVNALGGFAGAVLLALFALWMAVESAERILHPVDIAFNQAILVAVVGLLVNGASMLILGHEHGEHHGHHSHHDHEHDHHHHADHNLRSAYLHVLADALTSVLAIAALVVGKFLGWGILDPLMGLVGATLVARWSVGLLKDTSRILLDHQAPVETLDRIRSTMESDGHSRVADLHVWSIGPGLHAAAIVVTSPHPEPAAAYHLRFPPDLHIAHATIETTSCAPPQTDPDP
jgi:cation diffusion facilitator family transporter